MTYAKHRSDLNQTEIVKALRKCGAQVAITSQVGNGFPDLTICIASINILVEIKDGRKPPSQQKLTEAEQKFHDSWLGPLHVVRSVDEALELIKRYRKDKGKCLDVITPQ